METKQETVRYLVCTKDPQNALLHCTGIAQTFEKQIGTPRKDISIKRYYSSARYIPMPGERIYQRFFNFCNRL